MKPAAILLCVTAISAAGVNAWPDRTQVEPGRLAVSLVSGGNGHWYAVRYDVRTGRSHEMVKGAWVAIEGGPKRKQRSEYTVETVQTRTGRFAAVLLNTTTGESWHMNEGRWLPVAEE